MCVGETKNVSVHRKTSVCEQLVKLRFAAWEEVICVKVIANFIPRL